jgi:predicted phage tail protein
MTDIIGFGGGKGGGGSAHTPVESPDSLHSINHARILELVSEGTIQGFKHGAAAALQDVYYDRTPLQNADGSLNFKDVQFDSRLGFQTQDYIPGFNSVENEISDAVGLIFGTPYIITLTHTYLSAVRVLLSVSALSKADTKTGDIGAYSVGYTIELSTDGGSYANVLTGAFSGKTTTKYTRSHRIDLPVAVTSWAIRITRTTATATSAAIADLTYVESHTEVIDGKFTYPNSALCASNFNAAQFANIPVRAFDMLGRVIRVPSNYNPTTRVYTGVWDGTFQSLWSNNPAWVYFDMATNNRYGLGTLIADAQVDKWALYAIAQYCDGYVPTGKAARAAVTTGSISLSAGATTAGISCTGAFATGIFTATAHGFAVGDAVQFSAITGGVRVFAGTAYYVIATNLAANTFMVSTSSGGTALSYTTNMTAGTVTRAPNTYVRTAGSFLTDGFVIGDEVTASGFATTGNNGRGVIAGLSALVMTLATDHALTVDVAAAARTIATQAPTEPRFIFTAQFQVADDAYKVLQDIASSFSGISYWAAGMITAVADMPQSPVYTYSNSNVKDGIFSYSGSAKTARHTVALVTWSDDADFGQSKVEYVFDDVGVARYGIVPTSITAFGCDSQSQAQRIGRKLLLTERLITNTVTFSIGLDGTFVLPGKVIQIADAARAGRRIGGRLSTPPQVVGPTRVTEDAFTRVTQDGFTRVAESVNDPATVTIDKMPATPIAIGDTLIVMLPSGVSASSTVSAVSGLSITVNPAFSVAPLPQAQWAVQTASLVPQLFRVLSVEEKAGVEFVITAIQYNASIYSAVDNGTLINVPPVTVIPLRYLVAPTSVTLSSYQRVSQNKAQSMLVAEWPLVTGATAYKVQFKKGNNDWLPPDTVISATHHLDDVPAETYTCKVSALGPGGISSAATQSAALAVTDNLSAVQVLGIVSSATVIDARYVRSTLALSASTTFSFVNSPSSTKINVLVTGGGAFTITQPAGAKPLTGTPYVASTTVGVVDSIDYTTNDYGVSWVYTYINGVSFVATASPNPASASVTISSGSGTPSVAVTAATTGGTAPVTYSWARVDAYGGTNFTVTGGTTITATFSRTGTTTSSITQTWACTTTDNVGKVTSVSVPVTLDIVLTTSGSISAPDVVKSKTTTPGHPVTVSGTSTAAATFGTGPYTWLWTYVSGDSVTLANTTTATCTFSATGESLSYAGVYNIKATDTITPFASQNVNINVILSISNGL